MTELKTLKDFELMACDSDCYSLDLRQEAIKSIKSNEIILCNEEIGIPVYIIKAIQDAYKKHFFNITEKEIENA